MNRAVTAVGRAAAACALGAGLGCGVASAHAAEHAPPPDGAVADAATQARWRLMNRGAALLAMGDAAGALAAYEQASTTAHDAHIELGLLRAQMQLGDYRHALAFAAHTAGVHADEVAGRVLYAWLLDRGAQATLADATLRMAEAASPRDPQVQALRQAMGPGGLALPSVLRQGPAVLAPMAHGDQASPAAAVVASGLLLGDGRHALVPLAVWPLLCQVPALVAKGAQADPVPIPPERLWVRNGLGQTVSARLLDRDDGLGVALLSLARPLPLPEGVRWAPRVPFAGSPAYAFEQALDPTGAPAWPAMRVGFLGMADRLGVALPGATPRGGPVFDAAGRLVGLALRTLPADGPASDRLLNGAALRTRFGPMLGEQDGTEPRARADAEDLYGQGLWLTLQLLRAEP